MKYLNKSGDTLVEVLLATVVLSIVIAGAFAVSNRATQVGQNASERSQVSNHLQAQVEIIRAMRDQNLPGLNALKVAVTSNSPNFTNCSPTPGSSPIYIDYTVADYRTATGVNSYSDGTTFPSGNQEDSIDDFFSIWVELYRPGAQDYVDVHARACWPQLGGGAIGQSNIVYRLQGL